MSHQILLYYLYTPIESPETVAAAQRELCQRLQLKGRIILAEEGINGTVEGSVADTEAYVVAMHSDPLFRKIQFKRSVGTGEAFPKLSIKVRSEIVSAHLGAADINPAQKTAAHLSAEELHRWLHSDKQFYIVDMRNDYEQAVGHFAGSILPSLHHFRQLPEILPELEHLRAETVVTVCTGGVRCEKASAFLLEQGFGTVYQLDGGIVTYMEKYPNQDFQGQLYVFDGRVTMGFNLEDPAHVVIGRCERCNQPSEHYINCANLACHRHFICCDQCIAAATGEIYCGLDLAVA